ncbi:MAG: hypothetical protein Q8N47_20295 [Bryobacterales bacterium]|nr:hypothetical protein [Bryobacterales bacterium]
MYLLICEVFAMDAIRADLTAEVQVQLGFDIRFLTASEVNPEKLGDAFLADAVRPVILITLDRWLPKLIDSLDCNVVVLTRAGTVLLLANRQIAERALAAAPNLRSRLADVLAIAPDQAFGGARS